MLLLLEGLEKASASGTDGLVQLGFRRSSLP